MANRSNEPAGSAQRGGPLTADPALTPTAVDAAVREADDSKWTPATIALWAAIALLGGVAWFMLAIIRGETVNAIWFVFASVCTYLIGYRFYSKVIERYITKPDDRRATPAEYKADGKDYVRTDRNVLFGHHFAAIAGAGPLVGPVIAAQMGYLPGTIWIIIGVVLAGAVQDYLVLFFSMRRGGRSLGQMAREELGVIGGTAALIATLLIMVIIVAILALVVVNALAESPWGVFSVGMTIPIALFMGIFLRFLRPGKVMEVSLIGFVLLMAAIIGGGLVAETEWGAAFFTLDKVTIAWGLIVYGFIAAILPVWLLLAPRDYLSTFMKIGVIVMLALAIIVVRPEITVPAFSEFAGRENGPVFPGALFPFLFVTIACGALSGFHALISSGTTPKLIEKERQTRLIGYGGMLMESFVAIMALVAAISIDRGLYFAMNAPGALTGGTVETAATWVNSLGLAGVNISPDLLTETARNVGEESIVSRTGGAPTLAVGLAHIMQQFIGGTAMMAFWYHFAIMFEALFILTAVDAGTRVARFMLQDSIGNFIPKFKEHSWRPGAWLCTAVMVGAWGAVLLMGVTDPLGGINTLFPLFGIANQLLAAIALSVCLAIAAKRGSFKYLWIVALPLAFAAVVTITASFHKIFSPVPAVGYFANNAAFSKALADGKTEFGTAKTVAAMEAVVRNTAIQGWLSVIFVVLSIIVIATALIATAKAFRNHGAGIANDDHEDAPRPSRVFAPAGLIPSPAEKELLAEWNKLPADLRYERPGHH
jgi:carbon starvation protein